MPEYRKLSMQELNRMEENAFKAASKIPVTVVLDNIRSLHNIGSVFRTSDAFRIEEILLCGYTARPPHRDIHKTALGATETVNWQYFEQASDAISYLKSKAYKIVAIEQMENSVSLSNYTIEPDQKYGLVFGNEVKGVSDELLSQIDECIEIPQMGTKHSLNISVCSGILLWTFFDSLKMELN